MSVAVDAAAVHIRFDGRDRVWALSRGISIPLARVRQALALDREEAERSAPFLRMGGTYIPRRVRAGRYGLGDRRQLWSVYRARRVLAIDVVGRPSRVVIEVSDPEGLAREIEARLRP